MTTQPASSPKVRVTVTADGSGLVVIGGRVHKLDAPDEAAAMEQAKTVMAQAAQKAGRPLRFTAVDAEGTTEHLVIDAEATVTPDDGTTTEAADAAEGHDVPGEGDGQPAPSPDDQAPDELTRLEDMLEDRPAEETPGAGQEAPPAPAEDTDSPAPETTHASRRSTAAPVSPAAAPEPQPAPATLPPTPPSFITAPTEARPDPAEQGWQGWVNRTFGLHLAPSPEETRQREAVAALSRHWIGSRTVAVLNSKGGGNKTPTVIRLAAEISRAGGGGVLAWDNNESLGTLGWRTHSSDHANTVLDLLAVAPRFLDIGARSADLAAYVHHQPEDGFDVLRSDENPEHDHRITGEEVDLLHEVAARNWRLIVMDSGNSTRGENFTSMIDHTDQVVVATTSESDKAQGAVNSLQALHARGGHAAQLARNAVVIVSEVHPKHALKAKEIVTQLEPIVRSTHIVPFDPALIQGRMRAQDLTSRTRRAWQLAAADVIATF